MNNWHWLGLFIIFALLLRWGSFFISVLNHDESTYIVIAQEMLRGELYLRDVIDTKPIGVFWLYAALIKLTGGSIIALRVAASLAVSLGAWGLYLGTRRALDSQRAGVAAGLIYCLITSVFHFYGVSPNTEIFFNVLTIFAISLTVAPRISHLAVDRSWQWLIAGLLLGLAFCIKPFSAAEALAVGLFLVIYYLKRRKFQALLVAAALLVGGFLLPLVGVYLYFHQLGMTKTLAFYTLEVNAAYPIDLPWYLRLKYMGDYLLRFSPFVILGALAQVKCKDQEKPAIKRWGNFLFLQFLLVTVVVLSTGKRFGHYQIQLDPVLAALAGCWWALEPRTVDVNRWKKALRTYTPALLIAGALALGIIHYQRYEGKDDQPRRIANAVGPLLAKDETIFLMNGRQMTYYLLGIDVPTPYVHSSLLFYAHHVRAFRINEQAEATRIIANPQVKYLVGMLGDQEALDAPISQYLFTTFAPSDTLEGDIVLWSRK